MQRVPKPDPVQPVAYLARPDHPGYALACGDDTIKARVLLKAGNQLHVAPGFPRPA